MEKKDIVVERIKDESAIALIRALDKIDEAEDMLVAHGTPIVEIQFLMTAIDAKIETKLSSAVMVALEYDAKAETIDNEIKRLKMLKDRYNSRSNNIREYVTFCMHVANKEKIETDLVSLKLATRKQSRVDIIDESLIPYSYMREKVVREIDKVKIKEAIKNGEVVQGAVLADTESLIIK